MLNSFLDARDSMASMASFAPSPHALAPPHHPHARRGASSSRASSRATRHRAVVVAAAPSSSSSKKKNLDGGAIRARWTVDSKYGHKADALAMLGEWIHTVGIAAGLDPAKVSLHTGALGARESAIELTVDQFDGVASLDAFFAAIPHASHRAWGSRFAEHVVDGSPRWEIFRTCVVSPPPPSAGAGAGASLPVAAAKVELEIAASTDGSGAL